MTLPELLAPAGSFAAAKAALFAGADAIYVGGRMLNARMNASNFTDAELSELIKRPELNYKTLEAIDKSRPVLPRAVRESAEIQMKYEGYIARELLEAERMRKLEEKIIPSDINYKKIVGLRLEAAEKLEKIRPLNIGQASRISGVNPADVSVLLIYLKK